MTPLSRSERAHLRQRVDVRRRTMIDWGADARCAGCGVEQIDRDSGDPRYISGCRTCADRRSKHRRRGL